MTTLDAARVRPGTIVLALMLLGAVDATAQSEAACPRSTGRALEDGWRLLRSDSSAAAATASAARFATALSQCPLSSDAMVGLGFASLRRGQAVQAESLFADVTRRAPRYVDAWDGLATSRFRQGQLDAARQAWLRAVDLQVTHPGARAGLTRLDPDWERRRRPFARRRAEALDVTMRVWGERFEMRRNGRWQPFYVRGVLLGPGVPGRVGADAPRDSAAYAEWIASIATMHANSIRVTTLLPPGFYRALRGYNLRNPSRPVHLLQGIPATGAVGADEMPLADSIVGPLREIVDALHGAADRPTRPGQVGGWYDADVSPWTIGYLLAIGTGGVDGAAADSVAGAAHAFHGRHLTIDGGTATETWLVRLADALVSHEEQVYNAQRPIAFVNTPATDPMPHPAILSVAEERRRGLRGSTRPSAMDAYEDGAVSLTPTRVRRSSRNLAGWFASYEVFPAWPDAVVLEASSAQARSTVGVSRYMGYLRSLRAAHAGLPLLIAGFGVSSSRGVGHLHPDGWNEGGLSETDQADLVVRLEREIRESGAAGAVVAAWMDEWDQPHWLSGEVPRAASPAGRWYDAMNPAQHIGILAVRPGAAGGPQLGGAVAAWRALPTILRGRADSTQLRLGADPGYLYIALEDASWRGRPFDWRAQRVQLALDTYRGAAGGFLLPTSGIETTVGMEFLAEFGGPDDAQLRVTPDYNPFTPVHLVQSGPFAGIPFRQPVRSVARRDGVFDSLYVMTNRPHFRPDGVPIPALGVNQGRLRYGRTAEPSAADWWMDEDAGMLQVRIPWGLLNVTDPAARRVRADTVSASESAEPTPSSEPTDGIRAAVVVWSPGPIVRWTLPARSASGTVRLDDVRPWAWPTWEIPQWHTELKPLYAALQRAWAVR